MANGPAQRRILLVEDDRVDAIALRRALAPWEVVWVQTLQEGLEELASHAFDAIACDLGLPDTGAYEAVQSIVGVKPTRVPLVVLTGRDDDELASQLIKAGAQEFITKHEMSAKALLRRFRLAIERSGQWGAAEERQRAIEAWARSGQYRWEWDEAGDVFRLTEDWGSALGLSASDAPSAVWLERIHPDDRDEFMEDLKRLVRFDSNALEVRHRVKLGDDSFGCFSARIVALKTAEGVRLLGSHSDVSDEYESFCRHCGEVDSPGSACQACNMPLSPAGLADTLDVPGESWHGAVVGGRFRIERSLGAGAGGSVYLATDLEESRRVALKFLHPWLLASEIAVRRFEVESALQVKLSHPNIVQVVGCGEYSGHRYLALEYAAGGSLASAIKSRGRLPAAELLRLFIPLLRGLQVAHDAGIVHRDVKPSNILLANEKGKVVAKLTDFGVAKWHDGDTTATGAVIGTALYMAPEQFASSRDVDLRADIYAAGATLYHALAGALNKGPAWGEVTYSRLSREVLGVPVGLDDAIAKAMSFVPDDRYESCTEFADALENCGVRWNA